MFNLKLNIIALATTPVVEGLAIDTDHNSSN